MEERLALPVLVAALVSLPAVFMTTLDEPAATAGTVLNWASLVVLTGESVVLFLLARDRRTWLSEHRWPVAIAAATVPAVVFAIGPVQLLRLVRFVGALRVLRAGRILKAGRVLRRRAGLEGAWRNAIGIGVTVLAAFFVGLVLADPTSDTRQVVDGALDRFGTGLVVVAGAILAAATFVVMRRRDGE